LLAGTENQDNPHAAGEEILKFTFIEVNTRLCRMIPQKTWESKAAQRLNFHKKIELAKPSNVLAEQNLRETLEEIG